MELRCHSEVIACPQRRTTQRVEIEACDTVRRQRHHELPPHHPQRFRLALRSAGQLSERAVQFAIGARVSRHQPGAHPAHPLAPKIAAGIHHHHVQPLLDQSDERQERVAPRLALEQIVRRHVRRRHHHHAALEQRLEQPSQDHGIGDVVHLELVEAQQRRVGCDRIRQRRDRIVDLRMRALERVEARMDVLHEPMEVDALLATHIGGGKEQVHQHGLAAPDLAHDVEAVQPGFGRLATAEQPGEQPIAIRRTRARIVAEQRLPQPLQPLRHQFLSRVGRQLAGRHHRPEGWQRPALRRCIGAGWSMSPSQIACRRPGFNAPPVVLRKLA